MAMSHPVLLLCGLLASTSLLATADDPVVTTTKIPKSKTAPICTGDGTACKTIEVDNRTTAGNIEIKVTFANGSEGDAIEIGAGESHPVVCNVQKITAKANGADATVAVTIP